MHLFHRDEVVRDCHSHEYVRCVRCGRRKIRHKVVGGYYPVDHQWVKTGEFAKMPPPPRMPSAYR